jgi:hypothetical protein
LQKNHQTTGHFLQESHKQEKLSCKRMTLYNVYIPCGLNVKNRNMLNRVVNVFRKVVGESQMSPCVLYERRAFRKAKAIIRSSF